MRVTDGVKSSLSNRFAGIADSRGGGCDSQLFDRGDLRAVDFANDLGRLTGEDGVDGDVVAAIADRGFQRRAVNQSDFRGSRRIGLSRVAADESGDRDGGDGGKLVHVDLPGVVSS